MRRTMRIALVALAGAAACDPQPTGPAFQAEPALAGQVEAGAWPEGGTWREVWRERIEVAGDHWVPCADGGNGEFVEFAGTVLLIEQILVTEGRYNYRFLGVPQNLVGYGVETGDLYRDVGGFKEHDLGGYNGGTSLMLEEVYRMISPGPGDNFFYRLSGRIQYTPDGDTVVDRFSSSAECR